MQAVGVGSAFALVFILSFATFWVIKAIFGLRVEDEDESAGLDIAEQYQNVGFAWWESIFPALAIASLVVAVNLIADAVQQVLEG